MILALREGLRVVLEEGLDVRYARHEKNARALRAGLAALNLDLLAPDGYRLPQITPVWVPDGVDDATVRTMLLREHGIEIGGGLGAFAGKAWRIGLMGDSSRPEYVLAVLSALEGILPRVGFEVASGAAVAAASDALAED
jgi:alanine-glyoxylate transaminase/serine-glyoxylate transaminase/serine-pyruvate transaminase